MAFHHRLPSLCLLAWSSRAHSLAVLYWSTFWLMPISSWYANLVKPSWAPPSWLFGPVWTLLYILIIISFGKVFMLAWQKYLSGSARIAFVLVLPFALNIIFNLAFSPIQFTLQNNVLAAIDILLVLFTLIWAMIAIYPYASWITYIQVPYLLWVSFATVLQLTITFLNK